MGRLGFNNGDTTGKTLTTFSGLHYSGVLSPPAQDELIQHLYDYSGDFILLDKVDPQIVTVPDVVGVNCLSFNGSSQYARTGVDVTSDTDITFYVDATEGANFSAMGAANADASIRFQLNKRTGTVYRFVCGSTSDYVQFDIGAKPWFKIRMIHTGDCYIDDVLIGNTGYAITGYVGQFVLGANTLAGSAINGYFKCKIALFSGSAGSTTRDLPLSEGNLESMYDTVTSTALPLGDGSTASTIPTWIQDDNLNTSANLRRGYAKYEQATLATTEVSIPEYYDNRLAAFHFSIDDYADTTADVMCTTVDYCNELGVPVEVGVITDRTTGDSITKLQDRMDSGVCMAASHSKYHRDPSGYTGYNWTDPIYPWSELIDDVAGSFIDLKSMFTMPTKNTFNSEPFFPSWIQPWGSPNLSDPDYALYEQNVRSQFYDSGVLSDRSTFKDDTDWGAWDATLKTFSRHGVATKWNNWDVVTMTNVLNSVISAGGIASNYTHPAWYPWVTTPPIPYDEATWPDIADWYNVPENRGYYDYEIVRQQAGKLNVWYATQGDMYTYRYVATQATPTIYFIEGDSATYIDVALPIAERERYGLSVPVTYKWTNTTGLDSASIVAKYRAEGATTFQTMTEKTSTEFFNNIECFRRDGDDFYISAAMPQTGSSFTIKLEAE